MSFLYWEKNCIVSKEVRYNRDFVRFNQENIMLNWPKTNQRKIFVHYNREFVITEFVISEFDCILCLNSTAYLLVNKAFFENETIPRMWINSCTHCPSNIDFCLQRKLTVTLLFFIGKTTLELKFIKAKLKSRNANEIEGNLLLIEQKKFQFFLLIPWRLY